MKNIIITFLLFYFVSWAVHEPWNTTLYPQDVDKKWWDENWWQEGQLPIPQNHLVEVKQANYQSGSNEIVATILRPKDDKKYPAVLFQHGRRGLDEVVLPLAKRLAARGFVVLAPDLYSSHFIEKLPLTHDYKIEKDVAKGIEILLQRDDVSTKKVCVVSHTRGGYYTVKALVTHKAQKNVGCYVATYPHWQDPNKAEPFQVYQYAPEVDKLTIPILVMFGDHEQYQRVRPIMTAVKSLKAKGRDVNLIVYPGVGRGFDFRPQTVRTFADDLASKDSIFRTARFIRKHLN
jgi:carboxymethylenebutenolidase